MEQADQSMMQMVMVLRTTFKEPEKNSTDSTFQTISSQLKIFTTPITETSQVTLIRQHIWEDQITYHHTSTQNSVMVNSEPTLDLPPEEMVLMLMSSTRTALCKYLEHIRVI